MTIFLGTIRRIILRMTKFQMRANSRKTENTTTKETFEKMWGKYEIRKKIRETLTGNDV